MSPLAKGIISSDKLVNTVKNLSLESSKLKTEIFKALLTSRKVHDEVPKMYLAYINDLLHIWSDYAENMKNKMKTSNGAEGVITLNYNDVKPYIFDKCDYASILQLVDGIVRLIEKGHMTNSDDIEDFFDHTARTAFKDRSPKVAGLVDDVVQIARYPVKSSIADSKIYNAAKSQSMFTWRERTEIYKAIEKTVEFVCDEDNRILYFRVDEPKLLITTINSIVEYMTYTITAYITKVFVISNYAWPFISCSYVSSIRTEYVESSVSEVKNSEKFSKTDITVMHDADESICKNPRDIAKLSKLFLEFIKATGSSLANDKSWKYHNSKDIANNPFHAKLLGNPLYVYINDALLNIYAYDYTMRFDTAIADALASIKEFIYNDKQGLQGISSPKHEMLRIIRDMKPETETAVSYKELAKDLADVVMPLAYNISSAYVNVEEWRSGKLDDPRFKDSALSSTATFLRVLRDFYNELTVAAFNRARDIEMQINDRVTKSNDDLINSMTLNIPAMKRNDLSHNDNLMSSIPDTTRYAASAQIGDLYSLPLMESLQLYDEYVKLATPFGDSGYYTEAVNIPDLINKLISTCRGIKSRFDNFFNDHKFKAAVKWVQEHEGSMNNMVFTGSMDVYPYKKNTSISQLDKMILAIKNGFTDDTLKNEESFNKFIKSLYGDDKLYDLFNGEDKQTKQNASTLYINFILFDLDPSMSGNVNVPKKKLVDSAAIHKELETVWWDNVAKAEQTHNSLKSKHQDLEGALTVLKNKVVTIQNNANSSNSQPTNSGSQNSDAAPDISGVGNNQQQQTGTQNPVPDGTQGNTQSQNTTGRAAQNAAQQENKKDLAQTAIIRITDAANNIYGLLYNAITRSIKDQYSYIQEAYSRGRNQQ